MGLSFRPIEFVEWIVIHCSASPPSMDIGRKEIRQWHMERGFADIGYHYVIRRDGTIEKGREDNVPGAHAYGYNLYSLGIVLVGGVKEGTHRAEDNFTDAQFTTLLELLDRLTAAHPDAEVLGHRDLPGVAKACPSFDVRSKLQELKEITTDEEPLYIFEDPIER